MRLIDADGLQIALKDMVDEIHETREWGAILPTIAWDNGVVSASNIVDEQITVDAAPIRHGEWVDRDDSWQCSECGDYVIKRWMLVDCEPKIIKPAYCEFCGTKMDGGA